MLLSGYLTHRATLSRARGPLFLSESRRNRAQPLTLWTWSKVIRRIALDADLPRFSTHTTRHLCLTDLARMGWGLHAIATFAGHRSTESTLTYIHLSGRDLADKLNRGMEQIHGWRVQMLARLGQPATEGDDAVSARSSAASNGRAAARTWTWPVDSVCYDRSPQLSLAERDRLPSSG